MSADNFLLGGRGIERCDTVILGTPVDMAYPHNDNLMLSALLQVQRVAASVKRKVTLPCSLRPPGVQGSVSTLHDRKKDVIAAPRTDLAAVGCFVLSRIIAH